IKYLRLAAANETRRFANREAVLWLDSPLRIAPELPAAESVGARLALPNAPGRVRRSMGDMRGSSEAFQEAAPAASAAGAGAASAAGDYASTVEALLLAAGALTWFDHAACLAAAHEAERLAQILGPPLTTYVRGYSAYWYLLWDRWDDAQADDCERALAL